MKLLRHSITLVLCTIVSINALLAQSTELPNISSQYLTQGNDYSALTLTIQYADKKASWFVNGKTSDFSQTNLYALLDEQFKKANPEVAKQSNVKLEAPANMPIHYLQDAYAWVQIYGVKSVHLALYESMEPNKKQYLAIDVVPFPKLEEACLYFAANTRGSSTAIATFSQFHPNTERIGNSANPALGIAGSKVKPTDYIPKKMLHIDLREDEILFKGRPTNPMVLASLIQSELAQNYNNSYDKASPSNYLWLNIRMNKNVSYQAYAEILVALEEAFQLYWEELSFNKYQNAYLELDAQQKWNIQQSSPRLITQYDPIKLMYIEEKLSKDAAQKWSDLK